VKQQAVLQGKFGHDFLEGRCLATEILHLGGRRGANRVARQPALAGLEELLGPAILHRGGDPSRRDSSEIFSSPRRPSRTMRIFSSAENCRRV
jgi:hypothetical protein